MITPVWLQCRDHSVYVLSQWEMTVHCKHHLSLAEPIHKTCSMSLTTQHAYIRDKLKGNQLNYRDITLASYHLKSLATQLFVLQFVQANNKEIIKGAHYRPFVRGIHWWKSFLCHIIIMSSFFICIFAVCLFPVTHITPLCEPYKNEVADSIKKPCKMLPEAI